jgi:DNA helicase II / ATP-dependent DNA helicase PcrA
MSMTVNEQVFNYTYERLNEQQRQAVNALYGPVMVIAGPGTGKTEVLSMRIANLLRSEIQVQPQEILCLTYTDEATNAMRLRLVQVIGTAAHKVNICTFHAFCNNVIQTHGEYFSKGSLQPITDLERTEILHEILEQLPSGHLLRRLGGYIYTDTGKINNLFDLMKKEHIMPSDMKKAIADYIEDLPNRSEYIYQRAYKEYKKGDLKQAKYDDEVKSMSMLQAAADLYDTYTMKMKEKGRYDFNDMIIWVLDAFHREPVLLQNYQERFQYILVDEFQDTNGAQNNLITLLTEYWEDPNIFVVGDDDQSIYEFQGARIRNIIDFIERHSATIQVIVLPHNYRSSQPILDKATATIQNNEQRLIYQLQHLNLHKNLVAAAGRFSNGNDTVPPVVKAYSNVLHEEADIVLQIEELQKKGVPLNDIAIIYAQHKQAENIMALMERKGLPYTVKREVNILDLPLIRQVIKLLQYINESSKQSFNGEALLFELLHVPYFGIEASDIAKLALYIQVERPKDKSLSTWRFLIVNMLLMESMNLPSAKNIYRLGMKLEEWITQQAALPLPLLLERVIYESGMVAHLLSTKDNVWNMQLLHTFFSHVKEVYDRNPRITLAEFLKMLERMDAEKIKIPAQRVIQNVHGVNFYTAHSAKGHEFEYVYIIGLTKNYWENKKGGNRNYSLPDTITATQTDDDAVNKTEESRRLFYVALTRAKKYLHISYPQKDNGGSALESSIFIDEISSPEERIASTLAPEEIIDQIRWAMQPVPDVHIKLSNHQYIERLLQSFTMSYTTLSKYLHCPLSFYYEHILRVPFIKNDALAFGSAVHYALEQMFKMMKEKDGIFPTKEEVIDVFKSSMYFERASFTELQYERRSEQGITLLSDYYDHYVTKFHTDVEIELKIPRFSLEGVPVTGKIDKIEMNGATCSVVDYKTGDPDKNATANTAQPNDKNPLGGDYWRQMVFYKMLLERMPDSRLLVNMGIFDYVEKSKKTNDYKRYHIPMYPSDEEIVLHQLKDTYSRIMNHEFDKGCGESDCKWCEFARTYELVQPPQPMEIEL